MKIQIFWKKTQNFKKKIQHFEEKNATFWKFLIQHFGFFPSIFGIFDILKFSIVEKIFFENFFWKTFLFFIKIMLMRPSIHSSDPVTLPDTVHLLSEDESKTEKSEICTILEYQVYTWPPPLAGIPAWDL